MAKVKKSLTLKEAKVQLEVYAAELVRAKNRTADALMSVKSLERTLDRTLSAAEAWMAQVRGYEAETASHMLRRSIKTFFHSATQAVRGFFERFKGGRE